MKVSRFVMAIPVAVFCLGLAIQVRSTAVANDTIGDDEARQVVGGQTSCNGQSFTPQAPSCGTSTVSCKRFGVTINAACSGASFGSTQTMVGTPGGTDKLANSSTTSSPCMVCGNFSSTQCGSASITTGNVVAACSP